MRRTKEKPMTAEMFIAEGIREFAKKILEMHRQLSDEDIVKVWKKVIKKMSKEEREVFSQNLHLLMETLFPEEVS